MSNRDEDRLFKETENLRKSQRPPDPQCHYSDTWVIVSLLILFVTNAIVILT